MQENTSLQQDNVVPINLESPFKLKKVASYLEVLQVGPIYERLACWGGNTRSGQDLVLVVRDMHTGDRYAFITSQDLPCLHFRIHPNGNALKATPAFGPILN